MAVQAGKGGELHRRQSHEMNMEASNKLEAVEWMKAIKLGSFLGGQDQLAGEEALSDVLPDKEKKKQKSILALADKEKEEDEDDQEDQEQQDGASSKSKLKAAADEADVLSDLGQSKNKEQTAKRVLKMVKLLKGLISQSSKKVQGLQAQPSRKA